MEQIRIIKNKLERLKQKDYSLRIFGANHHRYGLNNIVPVEKIKTFEQEHNIILPPDYVEFMTQIGNGGAGPFYGIEPLENVLYADLDYKKPDLLLNPSLPFSHTEKWDMEFPANKYEVNEDEYDRQFEIFGEEYYKMSHLDGAIAICNVGCAISINLVVNGNEYGNLWTDDRAGEEGIYPTTEPGNEGRITFLNWYERWLDHSIAALKNT